MYEVIFYEDENGYSEILEFLNVLEQKSYTNKDARIQYKQIITYLTLLQTHGTYLGENITKHIDENIWELRPGNNRIFYFCYRDNQFVILHHFRKKTRKTPLREIQKAKRERDDFERRGGIHES